jgi:Phospholipase_D-nuclease N-terminal
MLIPAIGAAWIFGGGILGLIVVGLWVTGLVDVTRRPDLEGNVRLGWILLIVLLPVIGTLVYLARRPTLPEEREKIIAAQTHRHG